MNPTRSLLCGCCASVLAPVALAARRGHGPAVTPPRRGQHGAREAPRCTRGSVPSAKAVGAKHVVLDTGQPGNPTPADGLQMFVAALAAAGINRDQLQTMGRETAALLMG